MEKRRLFAKYFRQHGMSWMFRTSHRFASAFALIVFICICGGNIFAQTDFRGTVFTELPKGTDGTIGPTGDYVLFGDWPQSKKASNVIVNERRSVNVGAFIYYYGNDGNWYAKKNDSYFKVEPIKWRVLTVDYQPAGGMLLLAENILAYDIWQDSDDDGKRASKYKTGYNRRNIDREMVYLNNYEHSRIRAFLNGLSYYVKKTADHDQILNDEFLNRGFLQTAFSANIQRRIINTKIDNSNASIDIDPDITNYYPTAHSTSDKVFLLSNVDLWNSEFGFLDEDNKLYEVKHPKEIAEKSRIREATDYAKETSISYMVGDEWWLRSPDTIDDECVCISNADGKIESSFVAAKYVWGNIKDHGIVPAICIPYSGATLESIEVTSRPAKSWYFPGESLDLSGLVVTARYSDGSRKNVEYYKTNGFETDTAGISELTVIYNEKGIRKETSVRYAVEFPFDGDFTGKFKGTPYTELPRGTDGTAGSSEMYALFGDWPKTKKAPDVSVDITKSVEVGGFTYYLGSDGYFYVNSAGYGDALAKYSDGTPVGQNGLTDAYFKVEPIKWRILTDDYNGKRFLLAEDILADVCWYDGDFSFDFDSCARTIKGQKIHANNYEYSILRAYLNGLSYYKREADSNKTVLNDEYLDNGFLQNAFTPDLQELIIPAYVDNGVQSMVHADEKADDDLKLYVSHDTIDKIFLLSEDQASEKGYGFFEKDSYLTRLPTDFAKANGAYVPVQTGYYKKIYGDWWLRSPATNESVHHVLDNNPRGTHLPYESAGVVPALFISSELESAELIQVAESADSLMRNAVKTILVKGNNSSTWKDGDFTTEYQKFIFDYSACVKGSTTNFETTFTYTKGAHKLCARNVTLIADGNVVATFPEVVSAGGSPRSFSYSCKLSQGTERLFLVGEFRTSGGVNSFGTIKFVAK